MPWNDYKMEVKGNEVMGLMKAVDPEGVSTRYYARALI